MYVALSNSSHIFFKLSLAMGMWLMSFTPLVVQGKMLCTYT